MTENLVLTLALAGWLLGPLPAGPDRDPGHNVTTPPAMTIAGPPQLTIVPGSSVYHAPGLDITLFAFSGRYYRVHDGAWFHAASVVGPWAAITRNRLPRPVAAVPASYYKTAPVESASPAGSPAPVGAAALVASPAIDRAVR